MGQSVYLGNFDECVGVENVETDSGNFKGQHCLIAFHGKSAQFRTQDLHDVPEIGGFREFDHDVPVSDRTVSTLVDRGMLSKYLKLQDIFITECRPRWTSG